MPPITPRISAQMNRFLRIQNTLEDTMEGDTENITRHLIGTRLEILERDWAKFQSEHDALCLENTDEQPYLRTRTFERCQEFYVQARATLLARQDEIESSHATSQASNSSSLAPHATNSRRGLPRIEIPKFSGSYSTWRSFHDLFFSMVGNNNTLDNVEKMHYLKTCLTGDAAKLVINIPVSEDSFEIAWQKLVSRYENKRILISSHLERLTNLKPLQKKSARELNNLLSTISETLGALKVLGCPTDAWDAILVHLLSRLLDADTRELWELKLGPTTLYPTLRQFEEFLIGQSRAWETLELHSSGKPTGKNRPLRFSSKPDNKSRSLMATTSKTTGGLSCQVCKAEHYLHSCPKFQAMDIQRRRRIITEKRLCFNCFGSHTVARCSNTRRCLKCGKRHHSMIHDSWKPSQTTNTTDSQKTSQEAKDDKTQPKP